MKLGNKKLLMIFVAFSLAVSAASGVLSINYGKLSDAALIADFSQMKTIAKTIAGAALILMVLVFINNRLEKKYFKQTMYDVRLNYLNLLFKRHRLGKNSSVYTSHLSNDADRLEKQYYSSLLFVIKLVCQISVSVVILATYSLYFILVVMVLAGIFFVVARKTSEPVKEEEKIKSDDLAHYTHFIEESLEGFSIIKSHQIEAQREAAFIESIDALKKQHHKIEMQKSFVDALNGGLQGLIISLLIVFGLYIGSQNGVSLGGNITIMLVFSDILWPLQNVTPLITEIYSMHSIMSDYKAVLEAPEDSGELPIKHFESLTFKGASLGYDTAILNQVEISIEPGQHTLIIGPSGAGKSTLLKTIQRDIDVLDGEVLMNGKAIGNYDLNAYYQQLSIVDQVGFIFSGSVQENVSMLNMNPVDQVLNQVSLESLSPQMQLLNNGSNISGGQRARLLLARALNFKKELIICDEILSSLDHDVAKSIERDLIELSRTLINVSHIVFVENLHYYKQFVIVDKGRVMVTQDLTKVMARMMDSDIEFK